jgi:hypothetical protein
MIIGVLNAKGDFSPRMLRTLERKVEMAMSLVFFAWFNRLRISFCCSSATSIFARIHFAVFPEARFRSSLSCRIPGDNACNFRSNIFIAPS